MIKNASYIRWLIIVTIVWAGVLNGLVVGADSAFTPLSGINKPWLDRVDEGGMRGRNPFHFPRTDHATDVSAGGQTPGREVGLQLNAILYHEEGSLAIVNHRILRQGDLLGASQVVSILKDRVILRDPNGIYELKLGPITGR